MPAKAQGVNQQRVLSCLADGQRRTLREIADVTGLPVKSVYTAARPLRVRVLIKVAAGCSPGPGCPFVLTPRGLQALPKATKESR